MNTNQAKLLSLPDIMSRLGYVPTKTIKEGREVWYNSPFRNENTASFHTSFIGGKWIWNDFGDTGGTVIDFVLRHEGYHDVKDALNFLDKMFPASKSQNSSRVGEGKDNQPDLLSFHQQSAASSLHRLAEPDRQLQFLNAAPITNPVIFAYLEGRGIPRNLITQYLVEVRYRNLKNGKEFFAFAMMNESAGFEIRVASDQYSFKSALIARDISLIKGKSGTTQVSILEGMIDYLSLLKLLGASKLSGDAIILHSLSSFNRAADVIRSQGYETVNTFLDNDKAGEEHTNRFREAFGAKIIAQSKLFAPHTDLNDALRASVKFDFHALVPF